MSLVFLRSCLSWKLSERFTIAMLAWKIKALFVRAPILAQLNLLFNKLPLIEYVCFSFWGLTHSSGFWWISPAENPLAMDKNFSRFCHETIQWKLLDKHFKCFAGAQPIRERQEHILTQLYSSTNKKQQQIRSRSHEWLQDCGSSHIFLERTPRFQSQGDYVLKRTYCQMDFATENSEGPFSSSDCCQKRSSFIDPLNPFCTFRLKSIPPPKEERFRWKSKIIPTTGIVKFETSSCWIKFQPQ